MESSAYWQDRAEKNALHVFCYSQNRAQLVTRWFGRAQREMGQKIADFYRQYAEQEHITLRQAKATITNRRTLTLTMEEGRRLAQQYPQDEELQRLLRKSYLGRAISREEFLLMQLNLFATELYGGYTDLTHKSSTELFEESYYRSIFDTQQFIGFGSGFNRISSHQIEAAVTTAWQGKNYSQRIWGDHRTSLARRLNRIVTTGFIEGCSSSEMVVELQKAMSAEAYAARRLIRTECCAVSNRASLLGYQENGTEQYQILATLDYKTSELCRSMDGKIFDSRNAKPGTNLPPFHPFCRSTTVPYWQHDEFDADETRVARNAKGEVYKVPANLTYTQWHKQHVESDPAEQLAEQKLKNGRSDAAQYKQYRQLLGKDAPKSFDDFQNIKYTDDENWRELKSDYRSEKYYSTHLTHEEKAAVTAYVGGGSYNLNVSLRDGLPLTEQDRVLMKNLDSALEKLPAYEGKVIRTLDFTTEEQMEFMLKHTVNAVKSYPAYTSTSTLEGYHDKPSVKMVILSHTARDIRQFNESEGEILFRRGTKFKMLDVHMEDETYVIDAEEVVE